MIQGGEERLIQGGREGLDRERDPNPRLRDGVEKKKEMRVCENEMGEMRWC